MALPHGHQVVRPAGGVVGASAVEAGVPLVDGNMLLEGIPCLVNLSTVVTRVVNIFEVLSLKKEWVIQNK